MQNTAIEVHDLCKAYDGQPVLRGVLFAAGGNGIFGIAGRNGTGRTTTVEILQGLRSRDGGHVAALGLDPARERERRRPLLGAQLQTSALPDRYGSGRPCGWPMVGGRCSHERLPCMGYATYRPGSAGWLTTD